MLDEKTQGLWCRKDNKFYYLEAGPHIQSTSLDRVKRALVKRGLIEYSVKGTQRNEEPYRVMLWRDAKTRGYEPEPIFLNKHVKGVAVESSKQEISSPWD
jgi:hypothetical protein